MVNYIKLIALGLATLGALIAANYGRDLAYSVNMLIAALFAIVAFIFILRRTDEPTGSVDESVGDHLVSLTRTWPLRDRVKGASPQARNHVHRREV